MEELKALGKYVQKEGWEPLVAIVSEHGKCLCYHIYAERSGCFGLFRFSDDQSLIKDTFTAFKDRDAGNENYKMIRTFVRPNRHVVIDMTEFMEVA